MKFLTDYPNKWHSYKLNDKATSEALIQLVLQKKVEFNCFNQFKKA